MKWRYDEYFNLLEEDYFVRGKKFKRWYICWAETGEKVPNSRHNYESGPMLWAEKNQDRLKHFFDQKINNIILSDEEEKT